MRFLIVDDRPEDRELIILKLRPNFDAEFVEVSGADALKEALARGGIDLVLTDYLLHWTDGLQVLRRVKKSFPSVPVIMVTDSGTEELAVEGLHAGLSDYVLKHHLDRLPAAVQASLERMDVDELRAVQQQLEEANTALQRQAEALQEKNRKLELLAGELQAQQANMVTAIESTPMSILIIDTSGQITSMNPAARQFYGHTWTGPFPLPDLPRYYADHTSYDPPDLPLMRAVRLGEVQQNVELSVPTPDGDWRYILVNAVPLRDVTGHISGAMAIELDITSRKQAEEERERLLTQVRQEWERAERLTTEVNQRVKNNLAAIVGLLYAQLDRPGMENQPDYQGVIRDLIHWTEGLAIVHGMLSASGWAPLPLDELASRVIYSSLQSVPPGQVQIQVRPSSVRVSADQAHTLALVLNELATNVAKHALSNREMVTLNVEAAQEGQDVVLHLYDNGPGYSPDVLAQQHPGVGLGLARNLVQRNLRGQLALYNENGAVAEVRFPVQEEAEQQAPTDPEVSHEG